MKKYNIILLMLIGLMLSAIIVLAEDGPTGPQWVTNTTERFNADTWEPYNISAIAGNITSMNIHSWTLTRTWAGFYGNITGTVVLADTNNNTMYDWTDTQPTGRIYAARTDNVDWINIACAAQSELDTDEAQFSGTNETNRNGEYPVDAPNRTFLINPIGGVDAEPANFSDYPSIFVGPVEIDPSTCPSTSLHNENGTYFDYNETDQNAGNDPNRFRELILADGSGTGNIVYTTIIEDDYLGFDNRTHDFELMVADDGHGTDTSVTQYYFYIELL